MTTNYRAISEDYPSFEDIPPEVWERLHISREEFEAHRAARMKREEKLPAVGAPAPDFTAEKLSSDGKRTGEMMALSSLQGMPVALVFGNYT